VEERDREFTWRDGERTTFFREQVVDDAPAILAEQGWDSFELLTTPRAVASAPMELAEEARGVHYVSRGPVAEVSADVMRAGAKGLNLVALGGGRVIDAAKAIAAVHGGRVAAIPTTLSGAPMTSFHRLPKGQQAARLVRPAVVLADPRLMTALPDKQLRATAMNALAHGAESLYTPLANPVATMAALRGAGLLAGALDQPESKRDTAALALGALLCGYAVDSALFALHHVVCQSLVQVLGLPHAETNATMLPRTMSAMRGRAPEAIEALAAALGAQPSRIAARIQSLGGGRRHLADLGADRTRLADALDAIMARPQLGMTPDPPNRNEVAALIEAAW
jgi:maleylacetate reductase